MAVEFVNVFVQYSEKTTNAFLVFTLFIRVLIIIIEVCVCVNVCVCVCVFGCTGENTQCINRNNLRFSNSSLLHVPYNPHYSALTIFCTSM